MQSKSVSSSSVWLSLTTALLLLILFAFYYISIFSFLRNYLIVPFCQKMYLVDNPPILIFWITDAFPILFQKKEKINSRNYPTNEMNTARGLLNASFSCEPALSLIYRSFECCKLSTALYSAKLTVNFIHNNRHHCRHFDLGMSWNPSANKFCWWTTTLPFSVFSAPVRFDKFNSWWWAPLFASPWKFTQAYMLGFD